MTIRWADPSQGAQRSVEQTYEPKKLETRVPIAAAKPSLAFERASQLWSSWELNYGYPQQLFYTLANKFTLPGMYVKQNPRNRHHKKLKGY